MQEIKKFRPAALLLSLAYICGLYFFYLKYVPLIPRFQYVLAPALVMAAGLTILKLEWGTLFFIFCFPLINSLPYFFGIHDNIPHAPTALVLFLAYFLGVLIRVSFFGQRFDLRKRVFQPMFFFLALVLVSGAVTFLRYANFQPLSGGAIYELTTNAYGVSAGGAIMSVVFSVLNYVTGFIFFFLMVNLLESENMRGRVLKVLCGGAAAAIGYGLIQTAFSLSFGKNTMNTVMAMANGTFKDSLSFGTFIAMVIPLILYGIFACRGAGRIFFAGGLIVSYYVLFYTGSKVALISAFAAPVVFILLFYRMNRKIRSIAIGFLILLVIIASFTVLFQFGPLSKSISTRRTQKMLDKGVLSFVKTSRGVQWKAAASMVADYPVTGVGVGGYIIELPNYAESYRRKPPESVENYFLQVASELGIVGLAAILWIFGLIGLLVLPLLKNRSSEEKDSFLRIGLVLGIGTYFVHIFFHTYIGSYEIKYFAWLLVALALSGSRTDIPQRIVPFPKINRKLVGGLVLVLFAGMSIWNSTHSLSLRSRTEELSLKHRFGFYPAEKTPEGQDFRWTKKTAGLSITVKGPELFLSLKASHPGIAEAPVHVDIFLVTGVFREKKLLGTVELSSTGWKKLRCHISEEPGTEAILLFEVDRLWNPHEAVGSDDDRDIGVAVGEIGFAGGHQQMP